MALAVPGKVVAALPVAPAPVAHLRHGTQSHFPSWPLSRALGIPFLASACLGAVVSQKRTALRATKTTKTAKLAKTEKVTSKKGQTKKGPFKPEQQVGATEPLGFWDPMGICPQDEQTFFEYRVCEIKHGRVAMMACIGAVGQHFIRFGWFSTTTWGEPMPTGFAAVFCNPAAFGMIVLSLVSGLLEFTLFKDDVNKGAGNFGDPFRVGQYIGGYTDEMRNRELNNGRMAMISIMGIIAAEGATAKDAIEQLAF